MANYAPVVNTRGCVFTHRDGLVLRSTYHVFDLYVNELGDTVLDAFAEAVPLLKVRDKVNQSAETAAVDLIATRDSGGSVILAAVNKDPVNAQQFSIDWQGGSVPLKYSVHTLSGRTTESYNDINHNDAVPEPPHTLVYKPGEGLELPPHSVNIIRFGV
jgi:alpha-N-arabinofuranosidase